MTAIVLAPIAGRILFAATGLTHALLLYSVLRRQGPVRVLQSVGEPEAAHAPPPINKVAVRPTASSVSA